jgi:negative regulator of sigma-B (phosphoserine phosphatase)
MDAIKFGVVQHPKEGQPVSGDAVFIHDGQNIDGGKRQVLVAVIDGLGTGEEAAEASSRAVDCIKQNLDRPLSTLISQAHQALHGTRGVVMTVMRVDLDAGRVSFMGVGNVGVRSRCAANAHPVSMNGIVGYRLPTLKEFSYNYTPGDLFVLFSDGISNYLSLDDREISLVDFRGEPQGLAETIAAQYGRSQDDVTVVVVW